MDEDDSGDSWDGYESQFMFPGTGPDCSCDHETIEHGYAGCEVEGCPCEASWEHT